MAEANLVNRRIDAGVPRGPRKKLPRTRADNGQYLPILPKDPETIKGVLEDYCAGATLQQIADKWNVGRPAIYAWTLGKLAPEEHEELVVRAITARIARGDQMLESAPEPVNVTRGREMARIARMDFERLRPDLYGQKQEVSIQVDHRVSIEHSLADSALDLFKSVRGINKQDHTVIDLKPEGEGYHPSKEDPHPLKS